MEWHSKKTNYLIKSIDIENCKNHISNIRKFIKTKYYNIHITESKRFHINFEGKIKKKIWIQDESIDF